MRARSKTNEPQPLGDPDTKLMLRVGADEPGAFEQLVGRYQQRLLSFLNGLLGNNNDAEDLAQEVFLRVFRERKRYWVGAKFSTWLFTIAHNLARNALRDRQRRVVAPLGASVQARGGQPFQRMQQQELVMVVRHAIDGLEEWQRQVILLYNFEGLGHADIARVIGRTRQAVKSLLSRARSNLRKALRDYTGIGNRQRPNSQRVNRLK